MVNSNISWAEWQKKIIREEYKDIKPATEKAEQQINKTVLESLKQVKRYD